VSKRRLVSTRRFIAPGTFSDYDACWEALRGSAAAEGVRAWRFRSALEPTLYIEFLESRGEMDPRERPALRGGAEELDALSAGIAETWIEVATEGETEGR